MFIDRIYRINDTDTSNLNAQTLVTSASYKIATKIRNSTSKDTAFEGETTLRHTILCSYSQCLPPPHPSPAIPESCAHNMGFRLAENHSLQYIKGSNFQDFENWPLNTVLLNTGSTVLSSFILRVMTQTSSKQKAASLSKLNRSQINWENWVQESSPPWTKH